MKDFSTISNRNFIKLIKALIAPNEPLEECLSKCKNFTADQVIALHKVISTNNEALLLLLASEILKSDSFTDSDYKSVCIEVLKTTPMALEHVDLQYLDDSEFYTIPVFKNPMAFEFVPKKLCNYCELAQQLIFLNPQIVQFIPKSLPSEVKRHIYSTAVTLDGLMLEHIFEAQDDLEICKLALHSNIYSIEFMDEEVRNKLLNNDSYVDIVMHNYSAKFFYSSDVDNSLKLKDLLSNVEYILTFNKKDLCDKEINDCRKVYTHSPLRKGKIICVDTDHLNKLLQDILNAQHKASHIQLTILGHANINAHSIAGMKIEEITKLAIEHPIISQIHLLGCNSAQAEKLEVEKILIREYHTSKSLTDETKKLTGLILVKECGQYDFSRLLKAVSLEAVYVIAQDTSNRFSLFFLTVDNKEITLKETKNLTENESAQIQKKFGKKLDLSTALSKHHQILLKTKKMPLNPVELEILNTIFYGDKFSRLSSQYIETKSKYPFLSSITIKEREANKKLNDSLLKKLYLALKSDSNFTRKLIIKGYCNLVNVDIENQQFIVLPKIIYKKNYYNNSIFSSSNFQYSNVDDAELTKQRLLLIRQLENGNENGPTICKSIKIEIN